MQIVLPSYSTNDSLPNDTKVVKLHYLDRDISKHWLDRAHPAVQRQEHLEKLIVEMQRLQQLLENTQNVNKLAIQESVDNATFDLTDVGAWASET